MKGRSKPNNHITSEETWAQVNPGNKQLIQEFIEYMHATNHSDRTCKEYESVLRIVMTWILEHAENKHFTDVKKKDWVRFNFYMNNELKQSSNRKATIKSVIASLGKYIERVCDEEYPDFRDLSFVIEHGVIQPVWEKTILSQEDIDLTLETFTKNEDYQSACLVALLYYSGMRVSEVLQVRVDDFTNERLVFNGHFYQTHKMRTKGHGKEGYIIPRYVFSEFKPYYDRWMEQRNKYDLTEESLFVSQYNSTAHHEMTEEAMRYIVSEKMTKIIGKFVSLHMLRHCFVTLNLKNGWTQEAMADLLQWKSGVNMIKIYNDASETENLERFLQEMDGLKDEIEKEDE